MHGTLVHSAFSDHILVVHFDAGLPPASGPTPGTKLPPTYLSSIWLIDTSLDLCPAPGAAFHELF
jgi:hypothetical protein